MDSSVILDYLAGVAPRIAALTPLKAPQRRTLRPAEKRHEPWVDRVMGQLTAGLSALDAKLPGSGWIGGELGLADISVACAFGFTNAVLADVVKTSRYLNLRAFCARAEALHAFRATPAEDGATVSAIGD
jgi:glutathione S-transferase